MTHAQSRASDSVCLLCGRSVTSPLFDVPLPEERLRAIALAYVIRTSGRLRLMGDAVTTGGRVTG